MPPETPSVLGRVRSSRGDGHATEQVSGGADHRHPEVAPGRVVGGGTAPEIRLSDATFYKWRTKYGGMEASDTRRLKALEDGNWRLQKLLAEAMLDVATLREMLGKNF